ncbi:hypothetical protein M0Q28_04605 [Patescibacteria group bacterium]|nr:hypothetical protein [Patescibacteria group bacterium]
MEWLLVGLCVFAFVALNVAMMIVAMRQYPPRWEDILRIPSPSKRPPPPTPSNPPSSSGSDPPAAA